MRIDTLIKRLTEIQINHGNILVGADITSPSKDIVENYYETIQEIEKFSLASIEEPSIRQIELKLDIDSVWYEHEGKSRKTAILKLI